MESIQTEKIQGQTVEFLAHDLKGKEVVLQRNVEHPGNPLPSTASQSNSGLKKFQVVPGKGNTRFFADVSHLSNALRKKTVAS